MKIYIEHTNRKYRPTIEHPVGKFCLTFLNPHEYLLEKKHGEGYLTSGFPMLESKVVRNGVEKIRTADKIQYYDTLEEAQNRHKTMSDDWSKAYTILEVTEEGLIER